MLSVGHEGGHTEFSPRHWGKFVQYSPPSWWLDSVQQQRLDGSCGDPGDGGNVLHVHLPVLGPCQSGVWLPPHPIQTQIVNAAVQSCGTSNTTDPSSWFSTATCPAGWYLTGGGYQLSKWAPLPASNQDSNAPDSSFPSGPNQWSVHAGGAPGQTCFVGFAVCQQ